jgi:hypothetical protein
MTFVSVLCNVFMQQSDTFLCNYLILRCASFGTIAAMHRGMKTHNKITITTAILRLHHRAEIRPGATIYQARGNDERYLAFYTLYVEATGIGYDLPGRGGPVTVIAAMAKTDAILGSAS